MARPLMTARARATTCAGTWMVGTTSVVPMADVPLGEVTRQAVSRLIRSGSDQVSSAAAVAVPRLTHRLEVAVAPAGAVQMVTTSPGTAVPVRACWACQALCRGPVTVGANTGWMATSPDTAGP